MKNILTKMSTAELDKRLQSEMLEEVPDGELVREILRVLEEREKDYPIEVTPQIQAALEKFERQGRTERPRPTARTWVVRAASMAATAAVLCAVLLGVIPQPALADTWWEKLFNVTDSVFQFFNLSEKDEVHAVYVFETDNPGLQEVYEAVVEMGVTEPVVPMWLPEEYAFEDCSLTETVAMKKICAWFKSETGEAIYKLETYDANVWHEYHKDESEVVEYETGGVVYSVMQNNGKHVAIWTKDNAEFFLSINCRIDDFYKILDSIYYMEDK